MSRFLKYVFFLLCIICIQGGGTIHAKEDVGSFIVSSKTQGSAESGVYVITHKEKPFYIVLEGRGKLEGVMKVSNEMFSTLAYEGEDDESSTEKLNVLTSLSKDQVVKNTYLFKKSNSEIYTSETVNLFMNDDKLAEKIHILSEDCEELWSGTIEELFKATDKSDSRYEELNDGSLGKVSGVVTYSNDFKKAFITVNWDFEEALKHYAEGYKQYGQKFVSFLALGDKTNELVDFDYSVLAEDESIVKGSHTIEVTKNDVYKCEIDSDLYTYEFKITVDKLVLDPSKDNGILDTEYKELSHKPKPKGKKVKNPVVTFSKLPKQAYKDTSVGIIMYTDKKCLMFFDDKNQKNEVYSTKSPFVITRNGNYKYKAIAKNGGVTEGVLKVTCFVDDMTKLDMDAYFSDPNDPSASNILPQTGETSWKVYLFTGLGLGVLGFIIFIFRKRILLACKKVGERKQ